MPKKVPQENKMDFSKSVPIVFGIVVIALLIIATVFIFVQKASEMFANASSENNIFDMKAAPAEEEFESSTTPPLSVKECLVSKDFTTFIYLYSPTCPHCQRMSPIVNRLISEGYNIIKAEASSSFAHIASCVNIRPVVPQFICNLNGRVLEGEVTEEELKSFYESCK